MGYQRKGTIFNLTFEDPELEGLEVKVRKPSMDSMLKMSELQDIKTINPATMTEEDRKKLRGVFDHFADFLVSWNLEDENGDPVPSNREGFISQDPEFIIQIIEAWQSTSAGVNERLKEKSNYGQQFPEESIPMETLSPSQENLYAQS